MPIVQSGSFNPTSAVVPDLYVVIVPPSQLLLNGVPSNAVGLVGSASWGLLNVPTNVSSMANFSQAFGPVNNRKYDMATHAAVIAQQGGNNMYCVRVSDGTDAAATVNLVASAPVSALYTGTVGNSISVTLQSGAKANSIAAVVGVPGYAAEIFNNIPTGEAGATVNGAVSAVTAVVVKSVSGTISAGMVVSGTGITGGPTVVSYNAGTNTVTLSASQTIADATVLKFAPATYLPMWVALANAINLGQNALRVASQWVKMATPTAAIAPVLQTFTLAGGVDGASGVTASTLVGVDGVSGMYMLRGVGVSFVDLCDMDDSTQYTTVDSFAVSESSYAIQTLPAGTSVANAVTIKRGAGLDSAYSKLMAGDWLYWNDPVNQVVRLVSPQAFVAGRLSNLTPQLTSLNRTIYGVAGSQKSGVAGTNNAFYSTSDLSTLFQAGIDVVSNPGAGGIAIWTCRSGHNSSSNVTVHLDSYPTLTNYIGRTLAAGMGFYIGRTISPGLYNDITSTLTQFCRNLAGAGLLQAPDGSIPYAVQCNAANNPDSQTKIGIVTATVQAEYPAINEVFIVNLQGGSTITVTQQSV